MKKDDNFDVFLSTQLQHSQAYVPDDNFTASVMARLPAQKKLSRRQEQLIILIPLVIISLLVLSQFSLIALAIKLWVWLTIINVASLFKISLAVFLVALLSASYWFSKQCRLW